MKAQLFPSFSGLLSLLNRGFAWHDSPDCLYMFCCTKLGIDSTFQLYNRKGILSLGDILEKLGKAESEGRVLWRSEGNAIDGSEARMEWLIAKLKSKGVDVVENRGYDSGYYDAGWNLPALTRWLESSASTVIVVDREFGRHW